MFQTIGIANAHEKLSPVRPLNCECFSTNPKNHSRNHSKQGSKVSATEELNGTGNDVNNSHNTGQFGCVFCVGPFVGISVWANRTQWRKRNGTRRPFVANKPRAIIFVVVVRRRYLTRVPGRVTVDKTLFCDAQKKKKKEIN